MDYLARFMENKTGETFDALVATPGRLLDLMNRGFLSLKKVEVLVLDETAIHSVLSPRPEPSYGLHVYGGAIDEVERSQWLPDGTELPLELARQHYAPMWAAARVTRRRWPLES